MKVWQKGFLLVCIPVICDSCCVVFLLNLLQKTVGYATVERRQGELLTSLNQAYIDFAMSTGQVFSYFTSGGRNQINKKDATKYLEQYQEAMQNAKTLAGDNPEILSQVQKLEQEFTATYSVLKTSEENSEITESVRFLQLLKPWFKRAMRTNENLANLIRVQTVQRDQNKQLLQSSITLLQTVSYYLLAINLLCAILTLVILRSSIGNRLNLIVHKAAKLPTLSDLGLPLPGNDELVELDKALHQAFSELKDAQQFRSDITSMVAHDLRSPLTSIGLSLEMIESQTDLSGRAMKQLEMGQRTLKRLLRMIDDFLDANKMLAGKLQLHVKSINVESLVQNAVQMVDDLARMKNITVHVNCVIQSIKGDEDRLLQVLVNLISNSVKFSRVNGNVWIDVSDENGTTQIAVKDDGPGMSPEVLRTVFDKFTQDPSGGRSGGSGLGLFIVKWIVESHGGEITVESVERQGSTFKVRLS